MRLILELRYHMNGIDLGTSQHQRPVELQDEGNMAMLLDALAETIVLGLSTNDAELEIFTEDILHIRNAFANMADQAREKAGL